MSGQTSGLLFSYVNKSQYHDSCVPRNAGQAAEYSEPVKTHKESGYTDIVAQTAIWRQRLENERRCLKNWEDNWGFLAAYDAKGRVKEKEELPERSNMFSNTIPNTDSGNYGNRQSTELGGTMLSMEKRFFGDNRRRKLPSDMCC